MLFSVIKILLFLIAVGYSSGSGDYDNEDSEISYDYAYTGDDLETNLDYNVMKAVDEVANYKEPEEEIDESYGFKIPSSAELRQYEKDYNENAEDIATFSTTPIDNTQFTDYGYSEDYPHEKQAASEISILDHQFLLIHIISTILAFLLFVSFIVNLVQAIKIKKLKKLSSYEKVTNPEIGKKLID